MVVDFSVQFLEAQLAIMFKPQFSNVGFINFEFISPLSGNLQLVLWVALIGTITLHYIFENNIYLSSFINKDETEERYYPIYESLSYIGGVALQRDLGGTIPLKLGARITAIAFAFGMVALVTTYTAVLAAQKYTLC